MEITLEKIELVKDRTGVSYAEAKQALEEKDGSVIDAIILLEERIDIVPKTKAGEQASQIVEKIKQTVKKGNISRIVVKKNDDVILNIPVNVGILGVIFIPWVTVISIVAALGTKCSIQLVKVDGAVVDLSGKAVETFEDVKSNYSVIADDLKEKGSEALSQMKEKASSVMNRVRRDSFESDDDYFNFDDFDDSVFGEQSDFSDAGSKTAEAVDGLKEKAGELAHDTADKATEMKEKTEDLIHRAAEKTTDMKEKTVEKTAGVKGKVEELAHEAAEKAAGMKDKAENLVHKAAESADDVKDAVAEKLEEGKELAEQVAENAAEKAENAADQAEESLEKASDNLRDKIDEADERFEETIEDYKAKRSRFRFFE